MIEENEYSNEENYNMIDLMLYSAKETALKIPDHKLADEIGRLRVKAQLKIKSLEISSNGKPLTVKPF